MVAKWKEEAPYYDFTRDKGDKQTATLPFKIDQSKPWKNLNLQRLLENQLELNTWNIIPAQKKIQAN